MLKRVLDVGQCDYDHGNIKALCASVGSVAIRAHTLNDALSAARAQTPDLVLVNRLLDVDHSEGLAVIAAFKGDPALAKTPIMMVSNLPEAQAQAVAQGALLGFGKKALQAPETAALLSKALRADD